MPNCHRLHYSRMLSDVGAGHSGWCHLIRDCEASENQVLTQQLLCPYKNIRETDGVL